jgi:hypothetical protein
MIVLCPDCHAWFDDEFRTWVCPHDTFAANDGQNHFAHHPESVLEPEPLQQRRTQSWVAWWRKVLTRSSTRA